MHIRVSMRRVVALPLAWVLVGPPAAGAQRALRRSDTAALDSAFRRMVEIHGLVGLQVAIAGPRGVFYEGQFGSADLEQGTPVTPDSRFPSASVGKAFTAAALLRLWDRRAIDLDRPIETYVPRFAPRSQVITSRLLAVHQGGIRHYQDEERSEAFRTRHYDNVDDALLLFIDDSLVSVPGRAVSYSSYGYNLLAAAVQAAAGMPFARFVTDSVLGPLGLEHTTFDDARRPIAGRVRLYSYADPSHPAASRGDSLFRVPSTWDYSYNAGGGNWLTTARDLALFGQRLVRSAFLTPAARQLLTQPASLADGTPTEVTVGWFGGATHLGPTIRINGAFVGSYADLRVFPEAGLAIAFMTNTASVGNLAYATFGIAEYLLGSAERATAALEGALWFQFRRWPQAVAAYRTLVQLNPADERSQLQLGIALLNGGDLPGARRALREVRSAEFRDAASYYRVVLEALAGDRDAAFARLAEWQRDGAVDWAALERDRRLAALREDPRYARLHARAGRSPNR